MRFSVAELSDLLGLPFSGDGARFLERISSWAEADAGSLIFCEGKTPNAGSSVFSVAGCVIAQKAAIRPGWTAIVSANPKLDFARAALLLNPRPYGTGIHHSSAVVDPSSVLGPDVDLGPGAVVGPRCQISRRCILHAGVILGEGSILGEDCILYPRVVLYAGVQLGSRVTIHAGTIIGADGFGYVPAGKHHEKFPQAGGVQIGDDVEIGSNTTVDRGSLGTTRIGQGTKIDNLVQIAHNVQIGRDVLIAAQTGISGSTVIEDFAIIGGQVGFGDHARVESGAVIGSKAGILPGKIVRGGQVYWGVPVRPLKEYKTLNALFGRLPQMKEQITQLAKQIQSIEIETLKKNNPEQ